MAKCKNCANLVCDWCDMKADSPDPDMERECHWFAHATNADRIRSMSDEELAMFLQDIFYISGSNDTSHGWWLNWLKQEAADG